MSDEVHLLVSILLAIACTAMLVSVLRPLALRIDLVDQPGERKAHRQPAPMTGGIAMFCGLVFAALTLPQSLGAYRGFFAGGALLVIVGLLDDLEELSSKARFAAQIVASLIMVYLGGVVLRDFGLISPAGAMVPLAAWSVPMTVFAVVGVINATNMVDGLDGLAGSVVLVALVSLGWLCLDAGRIEDFRIVAVVSAAVVGFLLFNFPWPGRARATAFMGDAGSLLLGFSLGWFVVAFSQGDQRVMAPVTALWCLLVPLFDTVWLIVKRACTLKWPTQPGTDHLHHVLLRLGLKPSQAAIVVVGIAIAAAAFGLHAHHAGVPEHRMFYGFLGLFAVYCAVMTLTWWRGRFLFWPLRPWEGGSDRRSGSDRRRAERRTGKDRRES